MGIREDIIAIPDEKFRTGNISADYLVFMDFADAPKRWWTGFGDINTDGHRWQGIGSLINISDIPSSYSPSADQITFTLSSVTEEMLSLVQNATSRVYGRDVIVYQQFFDVGPVDAAAQPWLPLGAPFAVYSGLMDQMTFKASRASNGDISRVIELTAEGLFTNRSAPANGRWTDADQKRRYSGDKGCDRMHLYANYSPTWTV